MIARFAGLMPAAGRVLLNLGAMAVLLGLPGCFGFPGGVGMLQIDRLTPDEVAQGDRDIDVALDYDFTGGYGTISTVVEVVTPRDVVPKVMITSQGPRQPAPSGTTTSMRIPLKIDVAGDAPAEPVIFRLKLRYFSDPSLMEESDLFATSPPFYIHKQGAGLAPRIESIEPASLPRGKDGTPVVETLTVRGLNFDPSAVVTVLGGSITVRRTDFDPASRTVVATLELPSGTPRGETEFYVETSAGRSAKGTFMVVETPSPTITRLFPNSLRVGEEATVVVRGTEFFTGAKVKLDPVGLPVQPVALLDPPGSDRRDINTVTVPVRGAASGHAPLRVESTGGTSLPHPLEVSTAFLGSAPRIKRVTPAEVFAGTTSQVVVEVEGIDAPRMTELHLVPDTATASGELLPTTRRPTTTRVVRLATERTGSFDLALSSDTGRTTNAKPIKVVAPPPGMPFVSGTAGGRISLGSRQIGDTINGARLARAREIRFNPPVITASITSNTDSAIGVSLDAAPTGDLSGDVRTTFRVRTDVGWSNEADYVVTDDNVRFPDFLTPHLERVFPNFVYPGPLKSHFFAISNVLAPPAALVVDPAAAVREPRVTDLTAGQFPGRFLALEMFVPAPAVPTSLSLAVTNTSGGTTNPQPIRVLGPGGPRGPEITGMETTAQGYFSSTISQFRIVGRNFGPPETMALVFADRTGRPASLRRGLQIFAPTAERADGLDSVVVQFATQRETEARTEYIALAVDGLESNLAGEFTRMPPPATGPFITGLARGEVTRPPIGSPPLATFSFDEIQGVGLESVDRIEFDSPGISGGVILEQFPFSTFRGVSFRVEPDAALTGDAITTFRVFTTDGRRSNTVGIIVKP